MAYFYCIFFLSEIYFFIKKSKNKHKHQFVYNSKKNQKINILKIVYRDIFIYLKQKRMLFNKWCNLNLLVNKSLFFNFNKKIAEKIFSKYILSTKALYFFISKLFILDFNEKTIILKYFDKKFPLNCNFEYRKTTFHLNNLKIKKLVLQFPEGLQKYSMMLNCFLKNNCISLKNFVISSRTTFGACCVEDFLGKAAGACMILHYGHSCLFPISECTILIIYIFLEIKFDHDQITNAINENILLSRFNFTLFSTIQYISNLKNIKSKLHSSFRHIFIYSNKPLSPGEVLGCTSLKINNIPNVIYIGEGRFHLEATMISNSFSRFFQFNPVSQQFTIVECNMINIFEERQKEVIKALF